LTQPAPVRTYDQSLLLPLAPTSLAWARTWVRQLMGDKPDIRAGLTNVLGQPIDTTTNLWSQWSKTDVELEASLLLDAVPVVVAGVIVPAYRPHFTAGHIYLGDPDLWRTRSVDGSSETRRDPLEIVRAWLNQGRAFDALIIGVNLPPFETVTTGSGFTVSLAAGIPIEVGGL
jgi:hypothetical protein